MAAALEAAYTNPDSDITVFDKMPKKPANRRDAKGFDELKHV